MLRRVLLSLCLILYEFWFINQPITSQAMKTFFLITHIAFGFLALGVGIVPMLSKKGNTLHNRTGLVYYWSMVIVAFSSVGLVLVSPFTDGRLFLTGIAVFSFYMCFTGKRALQQRGSEPVRWYDWAISSVMGAASVIMMAYGLYFVQRLFQTGQFSSMSILFLAFGFFSGTNALYDIRKYLAPEKAKYGAKEWFFIHIERMGGSYIATFTAFALVNIRYIFPEAPQAVYIATWIMPGLMGGLFIGRAVRKYATKFRLAV